MESKQKLNNKCLIGELLTSVKEKYSFNLERMWRFNQLDLNNPKIDQIKKEYFSICNYFKDGEPVLTKK